MMLRLLPLAVALLACAGQGGTRASLDPGDSVQVEVTTDRQVYEPGVPIHLDLTISNVGPRPVRLHFASGQRYDFVIERQDGGSVWRWAADRGFIQVLGDEEIGPGETLTFGEVFEGTLAPGRYTIRGIVPALDETLHDTTSIEVR